MSFEEFISKKSVLFFIVVFSFCLNLFGRFVASSLNLPIWLDCIGSCITGCLYGPWCGGIVGLGSNISTVFSNFSSIWYAPINFIIGFLAGFFTRKNAFKSIFGAFNAGMVMTLASIFISLPINLRLHDGYTSNIFGDGVVDLMLIIGVPQVFASFLGELVIDFVDKNLACFLMYAGYGIYKKRKNFKCLGGKSKCIFFLLVLIPVFRTECYSIDFKKLKDGFYTSAVFNSSSGLADGEVNDIAFAKNGYLWVGTKSGLYKFDGNKFTHYFDGVIKNVNCLFLDEEGRLWIGTNDAGLALKVGDELVNMIDRFSGLSSNSIRSITQDVNGKYYIGTANGLNVLTIGGGTEIVGQFQQLGYAFSLDSSKNGFVSCMCKYGAIDILKDGKFLYSFMSQAGDSFFTCAFFDIDGTLLVGTNASTLFRFGINEDCAVELEKIDTKNLRFMNSFLSDDDGRVWICADNGVGCLKNGEILVLKSGDFNSGIENVDVDYQGNVWFTSSKLGLMRISESVFSNLHVGAGFVEKTKPLNAAIMWNGKYYFATDEGLSVMNESFEFVRNNPVASRFAGETIKHVYVDSKNHLWISTAFGKGLAEVIDEKNIRFYNTQNGTSTNIFTSVLELSDGTIAVSEAGGVDFISGGRIVSSVGKKNGLDSLVLCLYEGKNGMLYAGTDGDGIVVLDGDQIVDNIKNSLSSETVFRIVGDAKGMFVLQGSGMCYVNENGEITGIENIPHANFFDMILLPNGNGRCMLLSSSGIYVTSINNLRSGRRSDDKFLDSKSGLGGTIISCSWSYLSQDGKLFLCCDNGCYLMDVGDYSLKNQTYRIFIDSIKCDDYEMELNRNHNLEIDGNTRRITINPVVLNYTLSEPYVGYKLVGFDEKVKIVKSKNLSEISYSNLPNGNYTFNLYLYTDDFIHPVESVSYEFFRKMRIFDYLAFKIYFIFVLCLIFGWNSWFISKRLNDKKLAQAEKNIRLVNETIVAIAKTVDAKDVRTSRHSERVSEYSYLMASRLGWSEEECNNIKKMGLLHDIGKIGIPDAVLNKPANLTEEEYSVMKTHVQKGFEILKGFTLVKDVDMGVRYHHERYDGTGYPLGLKGNEIPVYARIIGIADAFDAMTSNRVYRNKLDVDFVVNEMRKNRGTQFDPEFLDVFLSLIEDKTIDMEKLYK